jgi:repressor LexA
VSAAAIDADESGTRQGIVYVIRRFILEHGYSPTVREIGSQLGKSSPHTIKYHLDKLRGAGRVTWETGKTRTLRVTRRR